MLKEWLRGLLGPSGKKGGVEGKLRPYLRDGKACAILRLILENPGITPGELVKRTGFDRDLVEGYLNGMVVSRIAVTEKEGRKTGYYIASEAKDAVVQCMPLNYQCPGMRRE